MKHHVVCVLFLSITLPILANGVNIVSDTCKKIAKSEPNVRYEFCVAAFESDPRSSTASLSKLAEISFKLSISKAKAISKTILKLINDPKFDKFQRNALDVCREMYSDAPIDLEAGLKAWKAKDYNSANIQVSGAITWADTCEDGFREREEFSPLTKKNKDFMELASIPLVFSNAQLICLPLPGLEDFC